jgi:SAM-dependent methyltransferase
MSKVCRPCPVCLHTEVEPLYENTMASVGGYDMSYSVGQCRQCGFAFAYSLPDDSTFEDYYKSVSKYDVAVKVSELDKLRIHAAVQICQGKIPFEALVADLGCGYGALLSGFKTAGWHNLYGVDPAPKSAERAGILFGLDNIYCGTMGETSHLVPLAEAGLVCIMAVLEHLPHLRTDLSHLLEKLPIGCRILVEVPALERFSGLEGEPFGEFSLEHIQFFSATSLENFFNSLGAKLLETKIVDLPGGDSLFGLFEWTGRVPASVQLSPDDSDTIIQYIIDSKRRLENAISKVPDLPLIIYGAGSHTARLLPAIERQTGASVAAVVDNNPNLLSKTIGKWVIQAPSVIESLPDIPILVSSYRFQSEIAGSLRSRYSNPLILLYE